MKLHEPQQYALQALPKWHPLGVYRRRLVRKGQALPVVVNGDALDLQVELGPFTLLATSFDYFDGCHHWLYLLRWDDTPVDQLRMPDQFGYIQDVLVLADNDISLGYFGTNDRWRLAISEQGFRSFSPRALLMRPNRFIFARRHLLTRRTAGIAWTCPPDDAPPVQPPGG